MGATVAGGVVGAAGALSAGVAEQKTSNANAKQLYSKAKEVDEKAKYDIDQLKRGYERSRGANVAKIASSDLNQATFGDVLADDALESFLERKAVRHSANSDIRSLHTQAANEIREGKNARTASYFNAASTALGAASKAVTMRSQFDATSSSSGGVSLK